MKTRLIEIFDTVTGKTLFYIRNISCKKWVETYMNIFHSEIKNWDYEIAI